MRFGPFRTHEYPKAPAWLPLEEVKRIHEYNLRAIRNAARLRLAIIIAAPFAGFLFGLVVVALRGGQ